MSHILRRFSGLPSFARWLHGLLLSAACLACAFAAHASERQPNIVLMLSDNLGFGEVGVYGGGTLRGAPTPRLDRLAAEGLRFTNFNVEVECTPSRSALMTGRMPVRSGTWRAASPGIPGGLAPWEVTIAEALSAAGYDTAVFGKWHLGDSPGRFPTDQGFDRWWGFPFSTNVASNTVQVGFDPAAAEVPYLLEGVRGEPVRKVEPYIWRTARSSTSASPRSPSPGSGSTQARSGPSSSSCPGRSSTIPTCPIPTSPGARATARSPT